MTVEKINAVQTELPQVQTDFKEESVQTAPVSKGSSKDVVTTLSVLAALGAAGIAIYKHKNSKKAVEDAVKKAEEEAKKKLEEAEQKAKQEAQKKIEEAEQKAKAAVEEVDKKIKEAVDKAKKEFETEKGADTSKPKKPKKKSTKSETGSDKKTSVKKYFTEKFGKVKSFFSHKKTEKTPETKPEHKKTRVRIWSRPEEEPAAEVKGEKIGFTKRVTDFFAGLKDKFKFTPKATKPEGAEEAKEKVSKIKVLKNQAYAAANNAKIYVAEKWNKFLGLFRRKKHAEPNVEIKTDVDKYFDDGAKEGLEYLEKQEKELKNIKRDSDLVNSFWLVGKHQQKTKEYQKLFDEHFEKQGEEIKQGIKAKLSGKTDYAAQSNSFIKEPMTQAEHDELQAFYDTFANYGTELTKAYKGIKFPDVTTVSEENLVAEYNALSKIVKGLPVEDATSQRFMEVKGELFNHRGYRFQDGRLSKVVKTVPKAVEKPVENEQHELQEQGKKLKQSLEEQLDGRGKLVPETPRKHNARYHNKLQKEYDKALGVKEVLPLEYRGLNEVERLYIERDALSAQNYGEDRAEARILEIVKRLEDLGVKENPIKKETPEIVTRTAIVREKAERDYWQSLVENRIKELEAMLKDMEAKGIKPLELDEKEAGLQYAYAKNIKAAQYQYKKNDMEWFQRFSESANKILEKLKEMGKEPLNFESPEMEQQYELMELKDRISKYGEYAAEMDAKAQELTKKLEEMIKN